MNDLSRQVKASLSTMWAINRFSDLNDFLIVAKRMGFEKIELNHQVNSIMLSNVNIDHYQFSSVHEPCPADVTTKELADRDWMISSTDEPLRKLGVESVMNSINLAHKVGAPIIVVHCGNVTSNLDYESKLRKLFIQGESHSNEYQGIKSQIIQRRAELARPRIEAVKKSLTQLIEIATKFKISLGLENRYHYMDIPSIDEMDELLRLADSSHLGFVYDVGHAQALDRLDFYPHEDWLKRYCSRTIGTHLHDVAGLSDHLAPGLGEIDFKKIAPYIPENSFRTVELQPGNTVEEIKSGLDILVEAGCIQYLPE